MEADLPYKSEYAKSGRAGCKGCKMPIAKDSLRIARMVQSAFHDGKQPNWFHEECLFRKLRPNTEGDIAGFELLRNADQIRIRERIAENSSTVVVAPPPKASGSKKGKKREAEIQMSAAVVKDFGVEYSASNRATCCGCQQKIAKGVVRVKKVVFDTEVGMKYGGQPLWHHLECFEKLRIELGWYSGGQQLPGIAGLSQEDRDKVTTLMPPVNAADAPMAKKVKAETKDEVDTAADAALEKKIFQQNDKFHKYRNTLKDLKLKELKWILEKNKQDVLERAGESGVRDQCADIMTFGALKKCAKCQGQLVFNKSNYICTGNLSEWVKCETMTTEPERTVCKLPSDLVTAHPGLKASNKVQHRALRYVPPSVSALRVKKEENLEPLVQRQKPPLYLMEFAIIGKTTKTKDEIKYEIEKLGGKLGTKIHAKLAGIISNAVEVERMNQRMQDAKGFGIQVLPESFLETVTGGDALKLIKTLTLCDWGTDPSTRIPQEETNKSKSKSIYTKSVSKSVTLNLKNGTAVDPDSGLVDSTHVYISGKTKYFAILCNTDIQRDKNSYYKLQLLEAENKKRYYIFRAWGRIGTTIGGNKLENFSDLNDAIQQFRYVYKEQTANEFGAATFHKKPGRYYAIDVDFGDADKVKSITDTNNVKSKLSEPVQNLMKLLFDMETMKKVMLEFDLDMEKMPLGKLSQKQLSAAMKVLNELSELVKSGGNNSEFIGKSNHFYNLVPHSFGMDRAPVIDTVEQVTAKTEMIEALMEIEIAYGMLQTDTDETVSPLDGHYDQLKTDIQALPHDADEFRLLKQYVENTHAETHRNFDLEIEDIFKVARKGEDRRYKPFRKLHNRKLLWHGSRLTNFVGIMSHGLKIAPPEAPVTGYMFGKGIYFADMVSKSANYCCTSSQNSTGLMLLCEVALGDMKEYNQAHYVTQLPKDKHSVKGVGKTCPNPSESHTRADGVEIPLGKPVTDAALKSSLLYNEYIVYDVSQLNVQYMFKLNFKHKY